MKSTMILPCLMIMLSAGACVAYATAGDLRRAIYWAAAAVNGPVQSSGRQR